MVGQIVTAKIFMTQSSIITLTSVIPVWCLSRFLLLQIYLHTQLLLELLLFRKKDGRRIIGTAHSSHFTVPGIALPQLATKLFESK